MRILLSNDDGIMAPGLRTLATHLRELGEVIVVAPDRNRSGASNSLTLDRPLRVVETEPGFFAVDGTPTDCVHLAITGLLDKHPDMVISGVNAGANLGDDVLYSGTVAAAMEGRFLGYPAIAVSNVDFAPRHFACAARVTVELIRAVQQRPLPAGSIINVNVPDRPYAELQGMTVCRLGNRHMAEGVVRGNDPRGRPLYWIGPAGPEQDAGPGTDFFAINAGQVAITPLQTDLTDRSAMANLSSWAGAL